MAYVHTTVNEMSKVYLATERRYNYTTPKTFLEQIKLYQSLLAKKRAELVAKIERLENGLMKLQSTASQVQGAAGTGWGRAAQQAPSPQLHLLTRPWDGAAPVVEMDKKGRAPTLSLPILAQHTLLPGRPGPRHACSPGRAQSRLPASSDRGPRLPGTPTHLDCQTPEQRDCILTL